MKWSFESDIQRKTTVVFTTDSAIVAFIIGGLLGDWVITVTEDCTLTSGVNLGTTYRELAGRYPVFEVEDYFLLPIRGEEGVSATKGRGRLDELLLSAPRQEIFRWQHCRGQKFVRDQAFAIPVNLWIAKSVPSGEGMAHSIESTKSLSSFISK